LKTKDQSKLQLLIVIGSQYRKWRRVDKSNENSYNDRSNESYYSDKDQSNDMKKKDEEEVFDDFRAFESR